MQGDKPFPRPQDALAHYGVKGMRWGHRKKEDDASGDSSGQGTNNKKDESSADPVLDEYKRLTESQPSSKGLEASKKLQANKEKFHDKFDDPGPELNPGPKDESREAKATKLDANASQAQSRIDDFNRQLNELPEKGKAMQKNYLKNQIAEHERLRDSYLKDAERVREGRLTSGQRKALVAAGVGAILVGTVAYGTYKENQKWNAVQEAASAGDTDAKLKLFQHHVGMAQTKTWMFGQYVTKESWDREEYELPAGHIFHRISTKDESQHGFNPGTYATHSEADFNRYVAGFRQEKGPNATFQHVTFTSTKPTRVPNLKTAVETLRETMPTGTTQKEALQKYQDMSGGSWKSPDAKRYFQALKEKGYGAIVDEMDSGVIGEKPVVFFDRDNATPKQSRPLDLGEIIVREKSVELMDRPPRKA